MVLTVQVLYTRPCKSFETALQDIYRPRSLVRRTALLLSLYYEDSVSSDVSRIFLSVIKFFIAIAIGAQKLNVS